MGQPIYQFPVTDRYDAREVTEPDFDIKEYPELYVDLSQVRSNDYLEEIKSQLNLNQDDELTKPANIHVKVVFSGYRGSGKTTELRKLQAQLNKPKSYISILVDTENELEVTKFKPEDFFVILITRLVKTLHDSHVRFASTALTELQKEWLSEKEVVDELNEITKNEKEISAGVSVDFLSFLKLGASIKKVFAGETKTARFIRQKIQANTPALVDKLNMILTEVRFGLKQEKELAKDILFIFDGSEKINYEVYESLFIKNSEQINKVQLNMIIAVPIRTFFEVTHHAALQFYDRQLLPMLRTGEASAEMKAILTKRFRADTIIEDDALQLIIEKSGGSIRQMLKIMNKALISTQDKITLDVLKNKILKRLSYELYATLTSEHKAILESKRYLDRNNRPNVADPDIWQLVEALILFKYDDIIAVNPLIADDFPK
ncbi:MAG: hypothetical protein EAZ67_07110 [Cytophagales bacterium]|nr:MAG: hypothetical protein EAZ67_07110 [Cytophagales bacterium]